MNQHGQKTKSRFRVFLILPGSLSFDRFANAQLAIGNLPMTQYRQMAQEIRKKVEELFLKNKAVGDRRSGDEAGQLAKRAGDGLP
jgi:hypothetical protein